MITNAERTYVAVAALAVVHHHRGECDPDVDPQTELSDLLSDLRHWAAENEVDFDKASITAEVNFNCEQDEESGS